VSSNEWYYR